MTTGTKTAQELSDLKRNWEQDPCWDIADTEGFEAHREELQAYQDKMEKFWDEQSERRKKEEAEQMGFKWPEQAATYNWIKALQMRLEILEGKVMGY